MAEDKQQVRRLSEVPDGQTVRFLRAEAGRGLVGRLSSLGLLPNSEITVVSNGHPGPFVVSVRGVKMMLGRGMATKIVVK